MKSNNVLRNYRYYVLAALILLTVLGIMAEPNDNAPLSIWLITMLTTKAAALFCGWLSFRLCRYWVSKNQLSDLDNLLKSL